MTLNKIMQETIQLAPSVVEDLIELAQDSNTNVRKQALMIILQSLEDRGNRLLFLQQKFLKIILNLVGDEETNTSALSVIIQLTQDEEFIEQFNQLKTSIRLSTNLKETVLQAFQQKREFSENEKITIELTQLALSNLTQSDEGKRQFLQMDEGELQKGFNFRLLFNFVVDQRTTNHFKHFLQVVLNLTSIDDCRRLLIEEQFKIFEVLKAMMAAPPNLIPISAAKNLFFEYENPKVVEAVKKSKIIDTIIRFLAQDVYGNSHRTSLDKDIIQKDLGHLIDITVKSTKPEHFMARVEEAIKCFVILTNIDFKEKGIDFDVDSLDRLVPVLRKVQGLDSSTIDQLDVVETCLVAAMKATVSQQQQIEPQEEKKDQGPQLMNETD